MSIGEKLKTIANRMRSVYSSGYTYGHSNGYRLGYDTGVTDGGINAREYCLLNHYTASVLGSGTRQLQAQIPFQPDVVTVYSSNPFAREVPNTFKSLLADMRSCCKHAAYIQYCSDAGIHTTSYINGQTAQSVFSYENGVWSFQMRSEHLPTVLWKENVRYVIVAVKFSDENAKSLVEEQIRLLPAAPPEGSTGTLTYSSAAIYTHFTEEQWQALTETKPNWSFVLQ